MCIYIYIYVERERESGAPWGWSCVSFKFDSVLHASCMFHDKKMIVLLFASNHIPSHHDICISIISRAENLGSILTSIHDSWWVTKTDWHLPPIPQQKVCRDQTSGKSCLIQRHQLTSGHVTMTSDQLDIIADKAGYSKPKRMVTSLKKMVSTPLWTTFSQTFSAERRGRPKRPGLDLGSNPLSMSWHREWQRRWTNQQKKTGYGNHGISPL